MGYPLSLAFRYLGSKKRAAFISVGTAFAMLGVTLGVAALAIVMSVTGGFQEQFREKVLGVNAHVLVLKYSIDFREYRDIMKKVEHVKGVIGVAPFVINPMMVTHRDRTATGVLLKGVDPDLLPRVLDLPKHIVQGSLEGLRKPGAKAPERAYDAFRQDFVIALSKISDVFDLAIAECRSRTIAHIELPPGESFKVEYVTNKSWSGYNWYQGNYHSLIQVNTDLPIYIDRAIDLACHEGYPGHHVYNALLEKNLVRDRGWQEFTVYALFSPQSLIAEGTANYGIEVAFPGSERIEFERRALFPKTGVDPVGAADYYQVQALVDQLAYAGNEAARRYLNGEIDRAAAATWLTRYAMMSPARAAQRTRFIDQYRSYVINYNLGKDLVKQYIESRGGAPDRAEQRWQEFEALLSSPRLPSSLAANGL